MATSLFAQVGGPSAPSDLPSFLVNLGVSVPVAGVLLWRLWLADRAADKERTARDAEVSRLSKEKDDLHREHVELVERMAPLLADATRALAETQRGMRDTMHESRPSRDVLQRLETLLDDIHRDRGAP